MLRGASKMRILTLLAGEDSLAPAAALTGEIRTFNREIDFRLRFLHIEIEEVHAAPARLAAKARAAIDRIDLKEVQDGDVLETAARLALILHTERPDLVVVVGGTAGDPDLQAAAEAAARACGVRIGLFGSGPDAADATDAAGGDAARDRLDLGREPGAALAVMTGVAREIS